VRKYSRRFQESLGGRHRNRHVADMADLTLLPVTRIVLTMDERVDSHNAHRNDEPYG
jgi:hypothetical protein